MDARYETGGHTVIFLRLRTSSLGWALDILPKKTDLEKSKRAITICIYPMRNLMTGWHEVFDITSLSF